MKDRLAKYGFVIATFALLVVYILFQRRGMDIEQLKREAEKQLLAQKLLKLREMSEKSETDYFKAMDEYDTLKRRHGDIIAKYKLFTGAPGRKPS